MEALHAVVGDVITGIYGVEADRRMGDEPEQKAA